MTPKTSGIRKAAILIASLDQAAAETVLARMDPAQAQQVRQAASGLGPVDPRERQRILDEFSRVGPLVPRKHPPGIELDGRLAQRLAAADEALAGGRKTDGHDLPGRFATNVPSLPGFAPSVPVPFSAAEACAPSPSAEGPPFRFLREAEADKLAKALAAERAQTAALVLAHLPPEQAGEVLVRLAPPLQVEVLRRLVDLEEADPETLHEVEQGLLARLSEQVRVQRRRVAGLAAVRGIVDASQPRVAVQLWHNLASHDRPLADRLGRQRFVFDDLARAAGPTLAAVVRAADSELLSVALVGAVPELVERVLHQLPQSQAKMIRRRLDDFGPLRLSDVEEARRRIAELVEQLAMDGRIELPRSLEPLSRAA